MSQFRIIGEKTLNGTITASGAKNAALKMIAASILSSDHIVLKNTPRIIDVDIMLKLVAQFGVAAHWQDDHALSLRPNVIHASNPLAELVNKLRASFVIVGPSLARFGEIIMPFPGGDQIGKRPLDTHLNAFEQLGIEINVSDDTYLLKWPKSARRDTDVYLLEPSVTATENVILATVVGEHATHIYGAAIEPEIGNLIDLLIAMGADIQGKDTPILTIQGKQELRGGIIDIIPDRIEIGTLAMAALITNGAITIQNTIPSQSNYLIARLRSMGASIEIQKGETPFRAITVKKNDPHLRAISIDTRPYPGFYTDLQSPMAALLTQADGTGTIFETMYEGRFAYAPELQKMGATISIDGPHKILVTGPTKLIGARVSTNDIRAGAALVLAGLAAKGETTVDNIALIDRGYEGLDEKLRSLGAQIERVD